MPLYEHVYLARQDISPQQVEALTGQFKTIVASLGGSVGKTEYWGVKSLAYRIKKNRKAHFTLMNIDAPPAAIAEMERQQSINEDVLRILTLRVEALEEGPVGAAAQARRRRPRRPSRPARRSWRRRQRRPWRSPASVARVAKKARLKERSNEHCAPPSLLPPPQDPAPSPAPMRPRSTIRTRVSCRATSASAARSFLRASPPSRRRSSANWRRRSSARAFWACCLM